MSFELMPTVISLNVSWLIMRLWFSDLRRGWSRGRTPRTTPWSTRRGTSTRSPARKSLSSKSSAPEILAKSGKVAYINLRKNLANSWCHPSYFSHVARARWRGRQDPEGGLHGARGVPAGLLTFSPRLESVPRIELSERIPRIEKNANFGWKLSCSRNLCYNMCLFRQPSCELSRND